MKPIIIINFKAYETSIGDKALRLAKIHDVVSKGAGKGANIMIAVQNADIYRISQSVSIPVLAQHADPVTFGSHTGSDLPEALKQNGADGTLINHSEDRADIDTIEATIKRCKQAGLKTIVCVENMDKAKRAARMDADYLAYEDPELIGSGVSVSKTRPDSVKKFGEMVEEANRAKQKGQRRRTVPLCGAGISSRQDIDKAIELGMGGVLLASAVTNAKDPKRELEDMAGAGV